MTVLLDLCYIYSVFVEGDQMTLLGFFGGLGMLELIIILALPWIVLLVFIKFGRKSK